MALPSAEELIEALGGKDLTIQHLQGQRSQYTMWLKLDHATYAEREIAQGKIDTITKVIDKVAAP